MLAKNEVLENMTIKLSRVKPDWLKIIQRFKQRPHKITNYDEGQFRAMLSEVHLRLSLEDICKNYPDITILDPIKYKKDNSHETYRTESYKFIKSNFGKVEIKVNENFNYCEYDQLMLVDELPIIFEVRLSMNKFKEHKKQKHKGFSNKGLNFAMCLERIKHLTEPLRELYRNNNFGYVLIVYPSIIKRDSISQQHFRDNNGILIPFYADRESFILDINQARNSYKI